MTKGGLRVPGLVARIFPRTLPSGALDPETLEMRTDHKWGVVARNFETPIRQLVVGTPYAVSAFINGLYEFEVSAVGRGAG